MEPQPVLEFQLSDDISMKELNDIYSLIKYIPWNEKEILEIKRVHTIIVSRSHRTHYDPRSFHKDCNVKTPYLRDGPPPIPKKMKKVKKKVNLK
jgi:hypothetical protein